MANSRNSRSAEPVSGLAARASEKLRQFVRPGGRLLAALSGGVDSVVLLHLLRTLRGRHGFLLSALHVNHGLSPNAGRWQAFCETVCGEWGIPLEVARVTVVRDSAEGPEAAARRARYGAFAQADADWLVLAHHRDDQAETLIFNLLRGAGVRGAAAMPVMRDFPGRPGLCILRPLLDAPHEEIEAFAREQGLAWIEDESNEDMRYARNFVRRQVFPLLRERFPGCDAALARAATHFAESDELLDQLARTDAGTAMREGRIVAAELARLDDARARNLMRHVLKRENLLLPDSARLHEIVRQICTAAVDSHLSFDLRGRELHRFRGEVWIVKPADAGDETEWHGEEALAWGGSMLRFAPCVGGGISRRKLELGRVILARRRGGEHLQPDCRRPRRSLKKLLQEHDVPPWRREALPLLWCGEELVWVPDIGIDCAWQCAPGEAGWVPVWECD
ncbi:MAG: tRNA lysidine(34) synthetase TilS [Rhodocyclaceae bacterium]|nr:tRNA lysidine(34) synthetase TilS [Rhodocyclaceae bacterium]